MLKYLISHLNKLLALFCVAFIMGCQKPKYASSEVSPNSIVIIPDIQNYTISENSSYLSDIVSFINFNKSNISLILQTGDMTNNNTPNQWNNVINEYINKLPQDIPHCECLGNHDYGLDGSANDRITNIPWDVSGGADKSWGDYNENYVIFFQIGEKEYGVMVLEFATRSTTLEWARQVLEQYRHVNFFILTHAFLDAKGDMYGDYTAGPNSDHPQAYDIGSANETSSSEHIFGTLCNQYPNIQYIISGHALPEDGYILRTINNIMGNVVTSIMVNFQHFSNGGNGNIAILNISKKPRTFDIYSTTTNKYIIHTDL